VLALASARVGGGRLAPVAAEADALGFRRVHASVPPTDAAAARGALEARGVDATGVDAPPGLPIEDAVARAVEGASALRVAQVVVEGPPVDAAKAGSREAAVDALARLLHRTLSREPALRVAVRHREAAAGLLGPVEVEWLLSELRRFVVGVWLDPWRAERAGAGEPRALDWADRFGGRVQGVALHGDPGVRGGPDLPSPVAFDWIGLREAVPGGAVRVLEVGPAAAASAVVECRRRFEESLGW
jgi:hypothetical protein